MKMTRGKIFKECLNKWRKLKVEGSSPTICDDCWWVQWSCFHADDPIPRDVPRGHLVVYVGEEHKRFIISVTLLKHPLFKDLLDRAQEEYEFTSDSKLCIPCEEKNFLNVIRRIRSQEDQKISLHF